MAANVSADVMPASWANWKHDVCIMLLSLVLQVEMLARQHFLLGTIFAHFSALELQIYQTNLSAEENMKENSAGIYDDRTEWINSEAEIVELVGCFQSWKYFARVVDEIRREYSFNRDLVRKANEFILTSIEHNFGSDNTRNDVVLVGIHVRVKDMSSNASLARGYSVAPAEYLNAAMEYFQKKFSYKLLFILATDDPEWCAKNFPSSPGSAVVRTPSGPDVLDLVILSNCNHMIITVGSFGWWAGWLSGAQQFITKIFHLLVLLFLKNITQKTIILPVG